MPSINVTESDFIAVAGAAHEAQRRGNDDEAKALDVIARKINAALSDQAATKAVGGDRMTRKPSWRDMPSTLT